MTQDEAKTIARQYALEQYGALGYPEYLPKTWEEAERWEPHVWVVGAIIHAHEVGRATEANSRGNE